MHVIKHGFNKKLLVNQKLKRAELGNQASDVSTAHCALSAQRHQPNLIIVH